MASNNPTFELGFFDDIQELDNVSEMVETSETSDKSKDQQTARKCYRGKQPLRKFIRAGFGENSRG